jgi:lysophospholipase L1-like esterase
MISLHFLEKILKEDYQVGKRSSHFLYTSLKQTANETNGFQTILTKQPCEVAVLLAGTNDLGHPPKRHDLPRGEEIAQNVWGLHELAHARSIHTIALAVPPSHYQAAVPAAATLRAKVNNILRAKCEAEATTRGLCTYVPFPFDWSKDSPLWEPDGLHLTAEGYDALGDSLAPLVRKILAKSEY